MDRTAVDIARDLARAAESGGTGALLAEVDALFAAHQDLVYAICLRYLGDPQLAAELSQEAMLRAWQKLPEFRGEARFSTWLVAIARYECLNARRKGRDLLTEDGVIEATSPEASALARLRQQEREALLIDAAATLTPDEQEAVHLRYVEHLPLETIEALLPIEGESGARGLLQRCKRKLGREVRRRLEELGHGSSFLRGSVDG